MSLFISLSKLWLGMLSIAWLPFQSQGPVGMLCQYSDICTLLCLCVFYWTIWYQLHKLGFCALWMYYSLSPTKWHNFGITEWACTDIFASLLHFISSWIKRKNSSLTTAVRKVGFWRNSIIDTAKEILWLYLPCPKAYDAEVPDSLVLDQANS